MDTTTKTAELRVRVESPVIDELVGRAQTARRRVIEDHGGDVAILDQLEAAMKHTLREAGFEMYPRTAQSVIVALHMVAARAAAHGLDQAVVDNLCGELAAAAAGWA